MDKIQTDMPTHGNLVIPKPQVPEATCSVRLSERDAAEVVAASESPPLPNEAALKAARRFLHSNG